LADSQFLGTGITAGGVEEEGGYSGWERGEEVTADDIERRGLQRMEVKSKRRRSYSGWNPRGEGYNG
jgi:hypothetical protein